MTVADAIRDATARLGSVTDTARLDAELLMADALGVARGAMLLRHLADAAPTGFAARIDRRAKGEPVAYITGRGEFYGLDLAVSPAVLIPRADSETLIAAARAHFGACAPRCILDLGTGSGCLLLAALRLWPLAQGVGLDASAAALEVARVNAAAHAPGARLLERDWTSAGWAAGLGAFDLILANPPYIALVDEVAPEVRAHEPPAALFAGAEGLDAYRRLIPALPGLLAPGGVAIFEIGATQAEAVAALAASAGLSAALHYDLAWRPRALALAMSAAERPGQ